MTSNQGETPGYYIPSNFQQNYRNTYSYQGASVGNSAPYGYDNNPINY